jgi:opacity protein-like surface antigen
MRLLLLTLFLYAAALQATTPDSLKIKKWAVGLTYSPDFCFRVRYAKASEKGSSNIIEKGKMGFTAGVNVLYQLLDRVGVEFGALYSTKGQKTHVTASSWLSPTEGQVIEPERHTSYTYNYLEIPLKVNVNLVNKRLKIFPSIGCSANIFMGKTTSTHFVNGDRPRTITSKDYNAENIPSTEFAILAGLGLSYDLTKKVFVKLEPSFRTFIRPLVDFPVSGTFYSVGANTGIYLKF